MDSGGFALGVAGEFVGGGGGEEGCGGGEMVVGGTAEADLSGDGEVSAISEINTTQTTDQSISSSTNHVKYLRIPLMSWTPPHCPF